MNTPVLLRPDPVHAVPDAGPYHRGGWLVALASLFLTLAALATGSLVSNRHPAFVWIPVLILGVPAAWGWWCVWQAWRNKDPLPRSHSLLAGTLGFDLRCTSCGVAATTFFLHDKAPAGGVTRLLLFLENYASRQRIAEVRILRHPGLGLPEKKKLLLHLSPGQAAVYEIPLRVAADLAPGLHSLPVIIQVSRPNGRGVRLPGSRRHLYDIHRFRYAAPFEVTPASAPPDPASPGPLPLPAFRTLASVTDAEPRLDILQQIISDAGPRPDAASLG
ncbi:hypothetical protein [Geminisphaera colitermitum]|uniref:hypothetical protein n=1 Tax=Geminisphaera colitermitum TaxID=1148786 RepID=UPI000158D023|nr:hypothetical protein [Geminisphaera colitermitum]